eukprot:scaffold246_cov242-Pinguiococcus_pyrenoidosus.AAC.5
MECGMSARRPGPSLPTDLNQCADGPISAGDDDGIARGRWGSGDLDPPCPSARPEPSDAPPVGWEHKSRQQMDQTSANQSRHPGSSASRELAPSMRTCVPRIGSPRIRTTPTTF